MKMKDKAICIIIGLYAMTGLLLVSASIYIDKMGWLAIPFIMLFVIWMSITPTISNVSKWIEKGGG